MNGLRCGPLKSFESYRKSKGTEWKTRVTKKKDGKETDQDVVITIGLLEWSQQALCLKPKRGQRLALRVNTKDPYLSILDKAVIKWKDYNCDTYSETEYVLTYSNGRCAQFMPGTFQFFDLKKYKEEVGKEFRRLVFYLCTLKDHLLAENKGIDVEQDSEPPSKQLREYDEFDLASHDTDAFTESLLSNLQSTTTSSENIEVNNPRSTATSTESTGPPVVSQGVVTQNASFTATETFDPKDLSLKEKIENISQAFQETGTEPEILSVRRRKLWQDTAQKLGRHYINCITPFSVSFIGEAGIDAGGPKREFFSLLFAIIKNQAFIESVFIFKFSF